MNINQSFFFRFLRIFTLISKDQKNINCTMVDVWGDVLRPPHCTTPDAVKEKKMSSFKSNENIHKKEDGPYNVVSANKASSVTL